MKLNNDEIIIYTALIGENEGLNSQPFFNSSKLRHVCLTDDKNLSSKDWEIILVERILPQDCYRSQRHFKIRPHLVFPNYRFSLYLDNTVVLRKKTEDFLEMIINQKGILENDPFFCIPYHSQFDLISEFNACADNNLDDQLRIYEQLNDYTKTNLDELKSPAYWGGILFRNHNHNEVKNLSEIWFSHICRYSRRDQLSIIHASCQSNINLIGFNLQNSGSEYHDWPVTNKKRKNRSFNPKYIDYIPINYLENLSKKINYNENLLVSLKHQKKGFRYIKKIFKLKEIYKEIKKYIKKILNF
nr:glycosyltransferase domain-containing protein [Prochlorococcus marinus]